MIASARSAGSAAGSVPDHAAALDAVLASEPPLDGLVAVAHRVVHGGERFSAPVLINDAVLAAIRDLSVLAPLHNPVNADGIEVARRAFPDLPHVAVFDTAFHATLPAARIHVRRAARLGRAPLRLPRHLARVRRARGGAAARPRGDRLHRAASGERRQRDRGQGAAAAIDTSMGLTPLEGLVMGTRSGDVDPALVAHVRRTRNLSDDEIDAVLNSRSGMHALAGDNDMREVHRRIKAGDAAADSRWTSTATGSASTWARTWPRSAGGRDRVHGRRGENDPVVRSRSLSGLERLGVVLDEAANAAGGPVISAASSDVTVLVIPTNEELEMARQAAALVGSANGSQ